MVNGIDPVPFAPQSEFISRVINIIKQSIGLFGLIERIFGWEITLPDFTHYGVAKYLTMKKAKDGGYQRIRVLNGVSSLHRFSYIFTISPFESVRLLKYHDITEYRNKLRAIVKIRNS